MSLRSSAAALGLLGGRSLVIIAILVLAVLVAQRLDLRWDASANRNFSIDPVLAELIQGIEGDTRIVGIWPRSSSQQQGQWWAHIGSLVEDSLALMARESAQLTWTHIDNEMDLPQLEALRERYGPLASGALYLLDEEVQRPFRIPLSGALPQTLQREVGGGLLALRQEDGSARLLLLQGHGELRPRGAMSDGAGSLIRGLQLRGFEVFPFDQASLEQLGRLPREAILVIAGPTEPIGAPLLQRLEGHLRDGGRMLILADHRLDPNLRVLLQQRGILVGEGDLAVLDRGLHRLSGQPPAILYSEQHSSGRDGSYHRLILRPDISMHDDPWGIMRHTRSGGRVISSPWSLPVLVLDPRFWPEDAAAIRQGFEEAGSPPLRAQALLSLPAQESWTGALAARQSPERHAHEGHIPIAWAVEYAPDPRGSGGQESARLLIWGSRQAASDAILAGDAYANSQLLADMLGWLADRAEQVAIPIADFRAFRVEAEESHIAWILALLVAIIPCCCLGMAMITWWERR